LAGSRVRYGYRRLTVLLKREGWQVNAKRIYRLYLEEGLIVRTQKRREPGATATRSARTGSASQPKVNFGSVSRCGSTRARLVLTHWHYIDYKIVDMKQTLGELEQTILLAVIRLGDEAYGVSIRREIALCTRREITPGALYTTLDRLERKSIVEARDGEPTPERGGRAKRFYRVTREGHTLLVEAQRSFQRLMDGLELLTGKNGAHHA
jgi:PadR family transcriptional regulator PadR